MRDCILRSRQVKTDRDRVGSGVLKGQDWSLGTGKTKMGDDGDRGRGGVVG